MVIKILFESELWTTVCVRSCAASGPYWSWYEAIISAIMCMHQNGKTEEPQKEDSGSKRLMRKKKKKHSRSRCAPVGGNCKRLLLIDVVSRSLYMACRINHEFVSGWAGGAPPRVQIERGRERMKNYNFIVRKRTQPHVAHSYMTSPPNTGIVRIHDSFYNAQYIYAYITATNTYPHNLHACRRAHHQQDPLVVSASFMARRQLAFTWEAAGDFCASNGRHFNGGGASVQCAMAIHFSSFWAQSHTHTRSLISNAASFGLRNSHRNLMMKPSSISLLLIWVKKFWPIRPALMAAHIDIGLHLHIGKSKDFVQFAADERRETFYFGTKSIIQNCSGSFIGIA